MFEALLHGKLSREQENMEDILTSMVFGTLQRSDPRLLGVVLRAASTPDGTLPFVSLPPIAHATYRFWPAMREENCRFCEPDVLIDIDGGRLLLLVEAKFRSGKSSVADDAEKLPSCGAVDQLAREWENLRAFASGREAWLLYITADVVMPRKDIEEAQNELRNQPARIAWISFRTLPGALRNASSPWIAGLVRALERVGLTAFEGMRPPSTYKGGGWHFASAPVVFEWAGAASRLTWNFFPPRWNWSVKAVRLDWRFAHG